MRVPFDESEDLAHARTHLANERTFLAWLRSSITLIALGLAAARFFAIGLASGGMLVQGLAVGLITAGLVLMVIGWYRHSRARREIDQRSYRPATRVIGAASLAIVLLALASVAFVFLMQPSS